MGTNHERYFPGDELFDVNNDSAKLKQANDDSTNLDNLLKSRMMIRRNQDE